MVGRVLVTGGTGFVGRHIVHQLLLTGRRVWMIGRDSARAASAVASVADEFVCNLKCDLLELGSPDAATRLRALHQHNFSDDEAVDAVVHAAALSSPWGRAHDFEMANVLATQQIVDFSLRQNVQRFIHISTPSLYFELADRLGIREDDALPPPFNHYARTKAIAEAVVRTRLPNAIVLRPRAVFGPWDQTLLPRLLRVTTRFGLPCIQDGKALIDMTYVGNLAALVAHCLSLQILPQNRVFNVTNGEPLMVRDLYDLLRREFSLTTKIKPVNYALAMQAARLLELAATVLPKWEPPLTRYSVGVLAHSQTLSIDRARTELDYVPRISVLEGLRLTATWWKGSV